MSSVEVVTPWLGGDPNRERAWAWCQSRYEWPITMGYGETPWIKARAVVAALRRSDAEIAVVADADVWCDGLGEAVEAVRDGAAWAIPHHHVLRLTEDSTAKLIAGEPWHDLEQRPYVGMRGGGYVVARRSVLLSIPPDPRFIGWGREDACWGYALSTLAGEPWRGTADCLHLWHAPQERRDRKWGTVESRKLDRRYYAARKDSKAMRQIIEEFRVADHAHQQALHHRQAA